MAIHIPTVKIMQDIEAKMRAAVDLECEVTLTVEEAAVLHRVFKALRRKAVTHR